MKSFLLSLSLLCSISFCSGRYDERNILIKQRIDSLDCIVPLSYKESKLKERKYTIIVKTQEDFDNLNDKLTQALQDGQNNIEIKLGSGIFLFNENHIERKNEHRKDVYIQLTGNNTIIASKGYNEDISEASAYEDICYANDLLEVVDIKNNLCFIPFKNNIKDSLKHNYTKVQVTQWFEAPIYDVKSIDAIGIYFEAIGLKKTLKGYSINNDYNYMGQRPRFRLYNVSKEDKCWASCFLNMANCEYAGFIISKITFRSNKGTYPLIRVSELHSKLLKISQCTFENIKGRVSQIITSDNVIIDKNSFINTYGYEINIGGGSAPVRVTDNRFKKCGLKLGNTICVTCSEAEYYIAGNTFVDFGYCAIGVGLWHGHKKKHLSKGIVEHNEMYYTPSYFNNKEKYTLMDGGAIYAWTQNDDVIIRYNYIHDYTGMGDNRGIFCDDGASNIKIYGNVILNVPNSYCIDSRRIKDYENGFENNANNFVAHNIIEGSVRLQGYNKNGRHTLKGANYVLRKEVNNSLNNKFDNLEFEEEDIVVLNKNSKLIRNQIKKCMRR